MTNAGRRGGPMHRDAPMGVQKGIGHVFNNSQCFSARSSAGRLPAVAGKPALTWSCYNGIQHEVGRV